MNSSGVLGGTNQRELKKIAQKTSKHEVEIDDLQEDFASLQNGINEIENTVGSFSTKIDSIEKEVFGDDAEEGLIDAIQSLKGKYDQFVGVKNKVDEFSRRLGIEGAPDALDSQVADLAISSAASAAIGIGASAAVGGAVAAGSMTALSSAGGVFGMLAAGVLGAAALGVAMNAMGNLGDSDTEVAQTISDMKNTVDELKNQDQDIKQLQARLDYEQAPYEDIRTQVINDHLFLETQANDIIQLKANDESMQQQINNLVLGNDAAALTTAVSQLQARLDYEQAPYEDIRTQVINDHLFLETQANDIIQLKANDESMQQQTLTIANAIEEIKNDISLSNNTYIVALGLSQLQERLDYEQLPYEALRTQVINDHLFLESQANDIIQLQANDQSMQQQINNLVLGNDAAALTTAVSQLQARLDYEQAPYEDIRTQVINDHLFLETQANDIIQLKANDESMQEQTSVIANAIQELKTDTTSLQNSIWQIAPIQDDLNSILNRVTAIEDKISYLVCPVGTILAWHSNTVPGGHLHCNGQSFEATDFPILYQVLGTNVVPDLRGYFLRGLDMDGTVDTAWGAGRTLGSTQTDDNKSHRHVYQDVALVTNATNAIPGQQEYTGAASTSQTGEFWYRDTTGGMITDRTGPGTWIGTSLQGSSEGRPKNKAVHYIIRAL